MAKRKIINIDEEKCNGCGQCIPNCPEGALKVIDGKVRLISDLFCDGLGACIGYCPEDAITIEEREAQVYNEKKVMENIVKQGDNTIKEHLLHLKNHNQEDYLKKAVNFLNEKGIKNPLNESETTKSNMSCPPTSGCPGTKAIDFTEKKEPSGKTKDIPKSVSQLRQWPIQIKLVPPNAPYLKNADLLIAADCVPFVYPDFHSKFLKGKILLIGCPKLDDAEFYKEKITQILKNNDIKSITCIHMEVPCCFGLENIIKSAISESDKVISYAKITIGIKGEIK